MASNPSADQDLFRRSILQPSTSSSNARTPGLGNAILPPNTRASPVSARTSTFEFVSPVTSKNFYKEWKDDVPKQYQGRSAPGQSHDASPTPSSAKERRKGVPTSDKSVFTAPSSGPAEPGTTARSVDSVREYRPNTTGPSRTDAQPSIGSPQTAATERQLLAPGPPGVSTPVAGSDDDGNDDRHVSSPERPEGPADSYEMWRAKIGHFPSSSNHPDHRRGAR
jgi:hypothetical protein